MNFFILVIAIRLSRLVVVHLICLITVSLSYGFNRLCRPCTINSAVKLGSIGYVKWAIGGKLAGLNS